MFSDQDRVLDCHSFDTETGSYAGLVSVDIPKHQGPPAGCVYGDVDVENNPTWNNQFLRVEYKDSYGAEWFVNSSSEKISLSSGSLKPEPPAEREGYEIVWESGKYEEYEDHRGEVYYSTLTGDKLVIEELGPVPNGYTAIERTDTYHKWLEDRWVYDQELERPDKTLEMREWRDENLKKVLNEIDRNRIDSLVPEEFKSSNSIDETQLNELYALRKQLQDFPETENFPFVNKLVIPVWLSS